MYLNVRQLQINQIIAVKYCCGGDKMKASYGLKKLTSLQNTNDLFIYVQSHKISEKHILQKAGGI